MPRAFERKAENIPFSKTMWARSMLQTTNLRSYLPVYWLKFAMLPTTTCIVLDCTRSYKTTKAVFIAKDQKKHTFKESRLIKEMSRFLDSCTM